MKAAKEIKEVLKYAFPLSKKKVNTRYNYIPSELNNKFSWYVEDIFGPERKKAGDYPNMLVIASACADVLADKLGVSPSSENHNGSVKTLLDVTYEQVESVLADMDGPQFEAALRNSPSYQAYLRQEDEKDDLKYIQASLRNSHQVLGDLDTQMQHLASEIQQLISK